eukprot:2131735-Amphidinium_carterae.1
MFRLGQGGAAAAVADAPGMQFETCASLWRSTGGFIIYALIPNDTLLPAGIVLGGAVGNGDLAAAGAPGPGAPLNVGGPANATLQMTTVNAVMAYLARVIPDPQGCNAGYIQ